MLAIVAELFSESNMAAAVAYDKVFSALQNLESECNFAERKKATEIKAELLEITRAALKKFTLPKEQQTKYFIAHPSRMLEREMRHWNAIATRRMRQKPNGRNPWKINFSRNLPFEVFELLKVKCELANGHVSGTKRKSIIHFTNAENVERLMKHGKIKPKEELLRKVFKNKDYGVLNCRKDRPFTISYSFTREVISLSFFYGVFNEFGIPKHI